MHAKKLRAKQSLATTWLLFVILALAILPINGSSGNAATISRFHLGGGRGQRGSPLQDFAPLGIYNWWTSRHTNLDLCLPKIFNTQFLSPPLTKFLNVALLYIIIMSDSPGVHYHTYVLKMNWRFKEYNDQQWWSHGIHFRNVSRICICIFSHHTYTSNLMYLLPGISMLLDRPMVGPLPGSMRYRGLPPNHEATSGRLWYVCVSV